MPVADSSPPPFIPLLVAPAEFSNKKDTSRGTEKGDPYIRALNFASVYVAEPAAMKQGGRQWGGIPVAAVERTDVKSRRQPARFSCESKFHGPTENYWGNLSTGRAPGVGRREARRTDANYRSKSRFNGSRTASLVAERLAQQKRRLVRPRASRR